jgi:hypothetical protein
MIPAFSPAIFSSVSPRIAVCSRKKVKEEESKPLNGNDVILPRSSYKEPSNGAITIKLYIT